MRYVCVINRQRRLRVSRQALMRLAAMVLDAHGVAPSRGVTIMLVSDAAIRAYNARFLGHDTPTDVISFADDRADSVGDVIISTERAADYSAHHAIPLPDELARYAIHGVLHCLGYDDTVPAARRAMRARQESLLRRWRRCNEPVCQSIVP